MENAGTYSLRDLSGKTGIGTSTVSDLIHGRKLTSERTMQVVADTLRLPVTTIREWAATARGEEKPFELPPEANQLNRKQRAAILTIVRAMVDPGEEPAAQPPAPDLSRVEGLRLAEVETVDRPADASRER